MEPQTVDNMKIPYVGIALTLRDGTHAEYIMPKRLLWKREENLMWTKKYNILLNQAVHIILTRHRGLEATEVTVSITNGFPNNGVTYFTNLKIQVDDEIFEISGKHIIRPRGIIAKRFVVGKDANKVRRYEHIPEEWVPEWLPNKAEKDIVKFHARTEDTSGPYKPFWNKFHSLSDSHSGAGIAPFSDWVKCRSGYELRSLECYGEICRSPIACLNPRTGNPIFVDEKYWLGRTHKHELPQFNQVPDDWCEYSQWLMSYQAHDYTHLWRMIRAAWQLAPYDPFARIFIEWAWHDCKLNLLGRKGDSDANDLFWSLSKLIKTTPANQGAKWADRGFYHVIRCFLAVEPYLAPRERRTWRLRFITAIRHVVTKDGVCLRNDNPPNHVVKIMGNVPVTRGFQAQLLASVYKELGLNDILEKFRETFPEWVPDYSETLNHTHHNGEEMYRPYNGLYNIGIFGYDNFEEFDQAQKGRGINGASQDYDCTKIPEEGAVDPLD